MLSAACALLAVSAAADDLPSLLSKTVFLNKGVVNSTFVPVVQSQPGMYLEPENMTRAQWAWADMGSVPYVFNQEVLKRDDCTLGSVFQNTDLPGSDVSQAAGLASVDECAQTCCHLPACMAWTYAASAPRTFGKCVAGKPCCYMKSAAGTHQASSGLVSGVVASRLTIGAESAPPTGIRTAPPLGGLGAGTLELRADGSMTAWTLENNNPAASAKLSTQRKTLVAAQVRQTGAPAWRRVLQTRPPAGLPGVSSLTFGGSPPVTRLQAGGAPESVSVTLNAFSAVKSGDMKTSTLPAITFSVVFENTGAAAVEAEALFSLPSFAEDTARVGKTYKTTAAEDAAACAGVCNGDAQCQSWQFKEAGRTCVLASDAPEYAFEAGTSSGTPGTWTVDASSGCLTLNKPGQASMHGNYSLCVAGGDFAAAFTGASVADVWSFFGQEAAATNVQAFGMHGAVKLRRSVPAKSSVALTVTLGYFFPNRYYLSQRVGNFYTTFLKDSAEAAQTANSRLTQTLSDVHAVQGPVLESTMPAWLSDTLIGSLHHWRSAWWQEDARWRQWEAYDCVNVDSVHNDGERHIPYIMLWPEATKSKVAAWGRGQRANGMINEQLACGCQGAIDHSKLDHPCGRVMSDVSSMYIVYLLELLKWGGEDAFVREWYPVAKKAADWQVSVSTFHGMPYKLQTTYDVMGLERYDTATYSAVFQILAMRAIQELAVFMNDTSALAKYKAAEEACVAGTETYLWSETKGAYVAYYGGEALMADSFYPQVLAYSLGMGTLVNATRLARHLDNEEKDNYDPFGLKIMTGRTVGVEPSEPDVWMMAPADHGSLRLRLGHGSLDTALEITGRPYKRVRELGEQWNAAGIYRGNHSSFPGASYITSHYGYYMTHWHTMLALSGQTADLPHAKLSFAPTVPLPFNLPVFLPRVVGTVTGEAGSTAGTVKVSLCVTTGVLTGLDVTFWGVSAGQATLSAGQCLRAEIRR